MRVKCIAQEHNTSMSLARAGTRTTRSESERTNHEFTMPSAGSMHRQNIGDNKKYTHCKERSIETQDRMTIGRRQ